MANIGKMFSKDSDSSVVTKALSEAVTTIEEFERLLQTKYGHYGHAAEFRKMRSQILTWALDWKVHLDRLPGRTSAEEASRLALAKLSQSLEARGARRFNGVRPVVGELIDQAAQARAVGAVVTKPSTFSRIVGFGKKIVPTGR